MNTVPRQETTPSWLANGTTPGHRRWQVMARLAAAFETWNGDYPEFVSVVSEIVATEIFDAAAVVLIDVPNRPDPVFALAHRVPDRIEAYLAGFNTLGPDELYAWADSFTGSDGRIYSPLPDDYTVPFMVKLKPWRSSLGLNDVRYAPLRQTSGSLRGILVCAREGESPPFDDYDIAALASASDTISLGLELSEARGTVVELADQRRVLLGELVNAEQAERERIAHDVHDDSIQMLAAAGLRMQMLLNELDRKGDTDSVRTASLIAELLSAAQSSLRRLLLDLEPAESEHRHIHDALREVTDSFFADSTTTVTITGTLSNLPPEVASVLFRAGREAVSNARRHAEAGAVHVLLAEDETHWRVEVIDDGIGIPEDIPARAGHLGVRGMRNRLEALGGACTIRRGPSGGTRVTLAVPRSSR